MKQGDKVKFVRTIIKIPKDFPKPKHLGDIGTVTGPSILFENSWEVEFDNGDKVILYPTEVEIIRESDSALPVEPVKRGGIGWK